MNLNCASENRVSLFSLCFILGIQKSEKCKEWKNAASTVKQCQLLIFRQSWLTIWHRRYILKEMQKRRKKWVSKAKDFTFLCDLLDKIWYIFLYNKIACWYMLYYIDMSASGGRKTFWPTRRSYKRCSEIVCFDVIEKRFFAKYINLAKFLKYWIPERIFKKRYRAPVYTQVQNETVPFKNYLISRFQ